LANFKPVEATLPIPPAAPLANFKPVEATLPTRAAVETALPA